MENKPELHTRTVIDLLSTGKMTLEEIENQLRFYDKLGGILLNEMGKADITVENLSAFSCVNRNTVYKSIKGTMFPERDTLLKWAFVMHMPVERTDVMLKAANRGGFSAHVKRDLIIMDGLARKLDLWDMNEELKKDKLPPLLKETDANKNAAE